MKFVEFNEVCTVRYVMCYIRKATFTNDEIRI
jgi:hypothetical protein